MHCRRRVRFRFTFSDAVAFRLRQAPVRVASAAGSLAVIAFYLIAQMVGAGNLIRLLFGLDYEIAVAIVGAVMLAYVLFGGMTATTWVQIIKAVMLLCGASFMAFMVLLHFGFSPEAMFAQLSPVMWEADARAELDDLAEAIDPKLSEVEEDVDTLGGLTFVLAGHVPQVGEMLQHDSGWRIEVTEGDERRVTRVRLHAPLPDIAFGK